MTKSNKIAIVCNYTLQKDRIGGMDRFYVAFDKELKASGYLVDWYFTEYQSFDFFSELTIFTTNQQSAEEQFAQKIKEQNVAYDIVITHFVSLCTSFFKQIKKSGTKHIIAVDHNPRPLEGFPLSKRIKNRIKGFVYSKYIDQFIGVSEYTTRNILKDYGQFLKPKTKVIFNGIDTDVFVQRTNANKNKFYVASHLRFSKGIQDLLMAVALLDKDIKTNLTIDIYGDGPMEEELKQLAHQNNLNGIVNFKGSSSDLHLLAANYSYMIQPTYMECFSLSILESLAANVPVITTTVGGNLEVVTHNKNGFIFEPKDVQGLSALLNDIVSGTIAIENEENSLIENQFHIDLMVQNHLKIIPDEL